MLQDVGHTCGIRRGRAKADPKTLILVRIADGKQRRARDFVPPEPRRAADLVQIFFRKQCETVLCSLLFLQRKWIFGDADGSASAV